MQDLPQVTTSPPTLSGLSEERTLSEREGSQRERGATRAGLLALAPADLSEERTQ